MASQQNQPSSNTATATTSNNAVAANLNTDIEQFINHIKQISPSVKHNFQDLLKSMIEYVMVAPKHHTTQRPCKKPCTHVTRTYNGVQRKTINQSWDSKWLI